MTPNITPSMEDYLKAIYRITVSGDPVTTRRIAERLAISQPSVSIMAKRLDRLRLIRHTRYHDVALTPEGKRLALATLRRSGLIERFLVETLGYAWDDAHHEAERLEHHISDRLAVRMAGAIGVSLQDADVDAIRVADPSV